MRTRRPRVLFASWHFYLDESNGASISTRALALELARRGWFVKTFGAYAQDFYNARVLLDDLRSHRFWVRKKICFEEYTLLSFLDHGVESVVMDSNEIKARPTQRDISVYLSFLKETLLRENFDILITYGGYELGPLILLMARRLKVKTVVFAHNLFYNDPSYFRCADLVITPSSFAAAYYKERLGINMSVVAPLMRPCMQGTLQKIEESSKQYALFVNPEIGKGVCFFIAIAREMWKIRSDIRFLVVEGRRGLNNLFSLGRKDLANTSHIDFAYNIENIDDFYSLSKITLFPSLYPETFGRVVAESLIRGIPTIGSNRGAIPEVLGKAGTIIDIPDAYTPNNPKIPTATEVSPWIKEIIHLWDDCDYYCLKRQDCLKQAEQWDYELLTRRYVSLLLSLNETRSL